MSKEWTARCTYCGKEFGYTANTLSTTQKFIQLRCPNCRAHIRVQYLNYSIESIVEGENSAEVSNVVKSILKKVETMSPKIDISNSQIGILNTGEISDIESITANASTLIETGYSEIASSLEELTKAVLTSQEISSVQRSEILDQIEELSRQAILPSEKRAKPSVLRSILAGLANTLGIAGGLAEVWSTWGPAISRFFGH